MTTRAATTARRTAATAALSLMLADCSSSPSVAPRTTPASTPATTTASPPATTSVAPQRLDVAALPGRWWQWAESVPPAKSPIDDATGASCALKQAKDVWFLAGTHGGKATRKCTVPAGRPIYFPVLNLVCEVGPGQDVVAAQHDCAGTPDQADAALDGKALAVKEATSKGAFTLVSPRGSTTFSAGKHTAVAWGLWVGPLTLKKGAHRLTFTGRTGAFATSATYNLTVR